MPKNMKTGGQHNMVRSAPAITHEYHFPEYSRTVCAESRSEARRILELELADEQKAHKKAQ
jgi:hypothetical protein